jgi:hypothetical protein
MPALPPAPLARTPWPLYAAGLAVLVAAAWGGARLLLRSSERADVAEVMRTAD